MHVSGRASVTQEPFNAIVAELAPVEPREVLRMRNTTTLLNGEQHVLPCTAAAGSNGPRAVREVTGDNVNG